MKMKNFMLVVNYSGEPDMKKINNFDLPFEWLEHDWKEMFVN